MSWRDIVGNRWVEIDTDAIRHNFARVKELVGPDVHILAVVKADAYGLGAVETARVLAEAGASMLGVTTVDEGVELREFGIELPILVMSPFLPGEAGLIIKYNLTPAVSSLGQVEALAGLVQGKGRVPVHLKIETGMGRTGILPEEAGPFLEKAASYPEIYLEGIFTHFARACQGDSFTKEQFARFGRVLQKAAELGLEIPFRHVCNSAATLDLPEMHLNMVRVGTVLYGQHPALAKNRLDLKDPWQIKARVIHLKEIAAGTSVGYGRDYVAERLTTIAVIPLGWADGLTVMPAIRPKGLPDLFKMMAKLILEYLGRSGTVNVTINGKMYPLVGRLGMQLSMVQADEKVKIGDEVQVNIRRLSTNPRLPRVYFKAGRPYLARMTSGEWELSAPGQTG
ncbi:alanine racemase [Zhaonella formicivorans]|uniref:alanine racemase n=1 Tax=Zhaonella formicivorans TaxID=2528593 RepID=UPI0010DA8C44|nr:alanine racemase [Zhaonella formicivorans]